MSAPSSNQRGRLSTLRMQLLDLHPFWGFLLLQLELVSAPEMSHLAATDCVQRLWYNPRLTAELDDRQLGFVLAHEVGHMAYLTHDRLRGRNRHLWNCATDYAINRIVARMPHPTRPGQMLYDPPAGILLDRRFDGLIAEAIYERLCADPSGLPSAPADGSAEMVGETRARGHGGGIDLHLPDALDADARERLDEMLGAAVAHWRAHGQRGDAPGHCVRAFDVGPARAPWQRLLRTFVGATLAVDEYDPRRPNRRWLAQDVYRPGHGGERVGCVVVALDSSGSMPRALVSAACAELRALAGFATEVHFVVADAKVQETFDQDGLDRWLQARSARGGGGTDHRPVFDWVATRRLRPDVFVGFTDLFSAFPARPPGYPVLWLTPVSHGEAPFGRVIVLDTPQ